MPSSISRGPITARLIEELGQAGFPVGDNAEPDGAHGWDGEPNAEGGSFTPWMILTPLVASPQAKQAFGDTGTEWRLPYLVFYAGVSRGQTEALADRARNQLTNIEREGVPSDTGDWRIQKTTCTAIGASVKVGAAYPDYYTQTDSFEVWISKER